MIRILVGLGRKLGLLCIGAMALTLVPAVAAFGGTSGFVQQGSKIVVGDDHAESACPIYGGNAARRS
jgi:hypothetical protein